MEKQERLADSVISSSPVKSDSSICRNGEYLFVEAIFGMGGYLVDGNFGSLFEPTYMPNSSKDLENLDKRREYSTLQVLCQYI